MPQRLAEETGLLLPRFWLSHLRNKYRPRRGFGGLGTALPSNRPICRDQLEARTDLAKENSGTEMI
jgi:hypothetical protein